MKNLTRMALLAAVLLSPWMGIPVATGAFTAGAVYTMTNASDGNEVVVFTRDVKGMLTEMHAVATNGLGSGGGLDPLASQGSLVLSHDERWLLAVNAGSNEISVFRVLQNVPRVLRILTGHHPGDESGLVLVDKVDSGGEFPVSLAIFHNLVYVLNARGSQPNITGFYLSHTGHLMPLDNSTRSLDGDFAQVGFSPYGRRLVVTDRNGFIHVFSVGDDGLPSAMSTVSPAEGAVPFGFTFDWRGHLLVSEAGTGTVTSYDILADDTLEVISAMVSNGQAATCWIARARRYAFTANTGSNTISSYKVRGLDGNLTLLEAVAGTGLSPIDLATTRLGRFLYVLNAGEGSNGNIGMFRIKGNGSLVDLGTFEAGLEIFAQGIAVR